MTYHEPAPHPEHPDDVAAIRAEYDRLVRNNCTTADLVAAVIVDPYGETTFEVIEVAEDLGLFVSWETADEIAEQYRADLHALAIASLGSFS